MTEQIPDAGKARADATAIYQESAQVWRHYASWREKILAGYFTALAALGVALSGQDVPRLRVAIYAAAILVSAVFWLLDFRNSQILNACQAAAARLDAPEGGYEALMNVRRGGAKGRPTFGLAIDVLVGGVMAASVTAIGAKLIGAAADAVLGPLLVGALIAAGITCLLQEPRRRDWNRATAALAAKGA